jgi:hypothetical protein
LNYLPRGTSKTILFAEAYAQCDTGPPSDTGPLGRIALYAWRYHNFGLTWELNNAIIDPSQPPVTYPNGMPNTYMFQVQPLPYGHNDCPAGKDCCNNWAAQTPHTVLNVALADGSSRPITGTTSSLTWSRAMNTYDPGQLGNDW